MRFWLACICLALAFAAALAFDAAPARADELRPAYLDMRESAAGHFAVLWKVPALGDLRLGLYVRLPDSCKTVGEPVSGIDGGAYFERWAVACEGGVQGRVIAIDGLNATATDVLARVQYLDGTVQIARLRADAPSFVASGAQTRWDVARAYFLLGANHILTSLDHLLFVLALILLISDRWALVKAITAFTVAHSISLAAATFGYVSLPQKPVEATIALSIAFLASEILKARAGEPRLSQRRPWLIAFAFGLLHGLGFARALKDIGLPQTDVPLALVTFNLGVEAGQLLFVITVLLGQRAATNLYGAPASPLRRGGAYVIGTASMLWAVTRVGSFIG